MNEEKHTMSANTEADNQNGIRHGVMNAIKKGSLQMRPRWYFVLASILFGFAAIGILMGLVYLMSLSLFFLHESGAWFAPSFGGRGWISLVRSIPWSLISVVALCMVVLEFVVRRYSFVYRKPLILSVLMMLAVVLVGGFLIAATPFHRRMNFFAAHHELPALLTFAYGTPVRALPPPDVYHGIVLATTSTGFVMEDYNGAGRTNIIITSHTHLPEGEDYSVGTDVVVLGDAVASTTVRAFGIIASGE